MPLELIESPVRRDDPNTPSIRFDTDSDESIEDQLKRQTGTLNQFARKALDIYPEPRFSVETEQEFAPALEAADIGKELVHKYHTVIEFYGIRVDYVFLKNTPIKNGREILGRAKKVSGLNAWLAMSEKERSNKTKPDVFFIIEVSWEIWRRLPKEKRRALVDHELSHCTFNEKGSPTTKAHDLEEFNHIVERHGIWTNDIREFIDAAREVEKSPLFAETLNETTAEDFEETEEVES